MLKLNFKLFYKVVVPMCTILVLLQFFMNIAKTRLHNKMKYDFLWIINFIH